MLFAADRSRGEPVGYAMRWIDPDSSLGASGLFNFEEISRLPNYSWKLAVLLAQRLAESVAQLHRCGVVIGDLNCENVLFQRQGTDWCAVLLDTDSFQLTGADGIRHHCPVSRPPTTAPELIGADLQRTWRHTSSDDFALAVLIHQLLLHDHPYDNAINRLEPDLPVTRRIARGLYPHAAMPAEGLTASPFRPAPRQISSAIHRAFRRSFHPSQHHPCAGLRPSAAAWASLLADLHGQLVRCRYDRQHHHPIDMACLWCELDRAVGQPISRFPAPMGSGRVRRHPPAVPRPAGALQAEQRRLLEQLTGLGRRCRQLLPQRTALIDRLLDLAADAHTVQVIHAGTAAQADRQALEQRIRERDGWRRLLPGHAARQAARRSSLSRLTGIAEAMASELNSAVQRLLERQRSLLDRLAAIDVAPLEMIRSPQAPEDGDPACWASQRLLEIQDEQRQQWIRSQLEQMDLHSWCMEGFGEGRLAALASHGIVNGEQLRRCIDQVNTLPGFGNMLQHRLRSALQNVLQELEVRARRRQWPIDPADLIPDGAEAALDRLESELRTLQRLVDALPAELEALRQGAELQLMEFERQRQAFENLL